jgi:cysteine desulfurase/selenocysteine lyase
MNVEKIRADFPILKKIIYMDSAATSLTPEPVLDALLGYYREYNVNVERGVYRLSQIASQRYEDAHRKIADFIGAKEEEVIFTKNTTEGINLIASGLDWKRGDKVVTSLIEHHSNFMPWLRVKKRYGIDLEIIKPNEGGTFDLSDFEDAIDERTKLVAITHVSNVLGSITPIKEIAKICADEDALLLVDGAQSVPHLPVDVKDMHCDFLAFSGHKMLGPKGTGVLFMKKSLFEEVEPLSIGGGTIDDVSLGDYKLTNGYERFEGGTPDIAGGIGLGIAVDYLKGIRMEEIRKYEERLTEKIVDGLKDIEKVKIYGPLDMKQRIGVVSFNIKGLNPHDVALMLDEASDIMVRSGHHCCMPLMKYLGLEGTIRGSLYLYNTEEEIEKFLETVEGIAKVV